MEAPLGKRPVTSISFSARAGVAACTALIIGLPLAATAYWLFEDSARLLGSYAGLPGVQTLTLLQRVAGLAISLVTISIVIFILWELRGLLRQLSQGLLVSRKSAKTIQRLSLGTAAYATVIVLTNMAISSILTLGASEGQRVIQLTVSSETVILYVVSAVLVALSVIVDHAADIQEDNAMIV